MVEESSRLFFTVIISPRGDVPDQQRIQTNPSPSSSEENAAPGFCLYDVSILTISMTELLDLGFCCVMHFLCSNSLVFRKKAQQKVATLIVKFRKS